MPIISQIGRRSLKVRIVLAVMYTVLALGAATMVYPLALMVSGSMKSDADFYWITPIPRYLWDDQILWQKYVESKYERVANAEAAFRRTIGGWRRIKPPSAAQVNDPLVGELESFRDSVLWPRHWFSLGHTQYQGILARNARAFRRLAQARYGHDVAAYSYAVGIDYSAWYQVELPNANFGERSFRFSETPNFNIYFDLKEKSPAADRVIVDLDGLYWANYLRLKWATIEDYNAAHATAHADYREVVLSRRPPPGGRARADWEEYVRNDLNLAFIRIDDTAAPRFQAFLRDAYDGNIDELNEHWATAHLGFDDIALPTTLARRHVQTDLANFVRFEQGCPLAALSIDGPRQGLARFTADRQGDDPAAAVGSLPVEALDYRDFQKQKKALRWEFIKRNYVAVMQYIVMHGNGIRNTVIFCGLMVLTQLLVNPLAAYALSRYRPPSQYQILLFCMCTMAFPAEVTMIPGFLLLKRFPLYGLAIAAAATLVSAWVIRRCRPTWSDGVVGVTAGVIGIAAGFWGIPSLSSHFLDMPVPSVSLLNTFWALILPSAANGFSIFLLKGFFDSLPQELYEAADLDGAGEWTKFWTIAMSLSKPILAVLALAAFTVAYSEFMMALVIIPDPDMWTIMVWLYQLQSYSHPSVVYASLVIAAIPTMLIFLFCQNIIMRGIVVPVER